MLSTVRTDFNGFRGGFHSVSRQSGHLAVVRSMEEYDERHVGDVHHDDMRIGIRVGMASEYDS